MTALDAENTSPNIWIEQRTFEAGKETIKARQLFFLERLVDRAVYIFKGCGDQILGVEKLPDLHLTARVVSSSPLSENITILLVPLSNNRASCHKKNG